MYSAIGVFPLPPQLRFPTLITGTGNLSPSTSKLISEDVKKHSFLIGRNSPVLMEEGGAVKRAADMEGDSVEGRSEGEKGNK